MRPDSLGRAGWGRRQGGQRKLDLGRGGDGHHVCVCVGGSRRQENLCPSPAEGSEGSGQIAEFCNASVIKIEPNPG